MAQQSHASSISREPAGSGGVPGVLALRLVADPSGEGHTFATIGTPVGSLVADPVEGFDATLGNLTADARLVFVRGISLAY